MQSVKGTQFTDGGYEDGGGGHEPRNVGVASTSWKQQILSQNQSYLPLDLIPCETCVDLVTYRTVR